jgi:hypothetical protein
MKPAAYLLLLVLVLLFNACKKDEAPPRLDVDAEIQFVGPDDGSNYATAATIEANAKIEGELEDYSFMKYYVLNASTGDTLTSGQVETDGDIHASWQNALPAGTHYIRIIAINHLLTPNEVLETTHRTILICVLPAVQITTITKNDTAVTVNWSKSVPNNFKAYELFVTRSDTARDRPPFPLGKTIAYITDINQTSFTYSDIFFYYKYNFQLRVISGDDCETRAEEKSIEAGNFITLPAEASQRLTNEIIFDHTRNKIYYQPSSGANSKNIYVIQPGTLQIENTIDVGTETKLLNIKEDGNALFFAKKITQMSYELRTFNLNTFTFEANQPFTLPNPSTVHASLHNRVLFSSHPATVRVYNLQDGTNAPLITTTLPTVHANNMGTLIVSAFPDSFYAYKFNNGDFELVASKKQPMYSGIVNTIHVPGLYSVSGTLYDDSFNLLHSLPVNTWFIGISGDGEYLVTSNNSILRASDFSEAAKYGDGFGGLTWFSNDNKTLYHLTEGSLNIKWDPPARLFIYPWQ